MSDAPPSDTIWVGNLPPSQTEDALKVLFEAYGSVVRARPLADSKGHGAAIIQMGTIDEATWIVENLNGNIAQGLQEAILVRFVKPKGGPAAAPAPGGYGKAAPGGFLASSPYGGGAAAGGGGGGGGGGGSEAPSDTVWVGNLPPSQTEEQLRGLFEAYGSVVRARPLGDSKGHGAAIVQFGTTDEAMWLVENLNGNIAQGLQEPIIVRFVRPKGAPAAAPAGGFGTANGGGAGVAGAVPFGGGAAAGGEGGMAAIVAELGTSGGLPTVPKENLTQLYIAGLLPDTTDLDLYKLFTPFGCPIRPNGATAMLKPDGSCTGTGFVDIMEPTTAEAAIQALNGMQLPNGNRLRVQQKRQR